ncbi:trypsin-like [Glossina fuscipes fuscipes]
MTSTTIYFIKILLLTAVLTDAHSRKHYLSKSYVPMSTRIVGGHSTTIAEHPYMVSIRARNHFICGGTLVSTKCVMTAAHCSILASPSRWQVHAGTTFLKSHGIARTVRKWMVPADFNFFSIDMDVALLQLSRPLHEPILRPIEIDFSPLEEDDDVIVTGWGLKKEYPAAKLSNELQAVTVTLTNTEKCIKAYSEQNNVTENMFCAIGEHGSDACQGDSGGPAIRDGKQVGIVSWGYRCGTPKYPGVYTRLGSQNITRFLKFLLPLYC